MELLLKKSTEKEIILLHEILVACGKEMYDRFNLTHWHPFMDLETFKKVMKDKDLYGVYQNQTAIATFNISTQSRDYYHEELWSNPGEKALYLGQLAINPALQKKGIGKWCMQQVERMAFKMGCKAIRFDALDSHPWLKAFYKNLDYSPCGIVTPNKWDLACFEKIINN